VWTFKKKYKANGIKQCMQRSTIANFQSKVTHVFTSLLFTMNLEKECDGIASELSFLYNCASCEHQFQGAANDFEFQEHK